MKANKLRFFCVDLNFLGAKLFHYLFTIILHIPNGKIKGATPRNKQSAIRVLKYPGMKYTVKNVISIS